MYLQGPFSTPETSGHGWQFALNPRDTYTDALTALESDSQQHFKNSFEQLSPRLRQVQEHGMVAGSSVDRMSRVVSVG
jgi:hypothetical protein